MNLAIILLAVYLVVVIAIGWHASRRERKEDYLIAGRKLGVAAFAFTVGASVIGGNTLVNFSGFFYSYGLVILWAILGYLLGYLIMIPIGKRLKAMSKRFKFYTMPDYFTKLYGKQTGLVATSLIIIWYLLAITVQFIAGAYIITSISPIGYHLAVGIMALVIVGYLLLGGFRAVVRTDIFQYLAFGVLLVLVGFFVSGNVQIDLSQAVDFSNIGWAKMIAFFIIGISFIMTAPEVWQRIYASKSTKTTQNGLIVSGVIVIITILALAALSLAVKQAGIDVAPEAVAIIGIQQLLPTGLSALGIVIFFAVIMSTIDTFLFILGNNYAEDIWKNFVDKKTDLLKKTREGIIVAAVIAGVVALFFTDILAIGLSFMSIHLAFLPIIIGSFFWKLKSRAVQWSLLSALAAVIILLVLGFIGPETSIVSLPVSLIVLLIGQRVFRA